MRQTLPFLAIALSLSLLSPASAAYVLVNDFDGVVGTELTTDPNIYGFRADQSVFVPSPTLTAGDQAGQVNGAGSPGGLATELGFDGFTISDNSTGTIFFQLTLPTTNTSFDPDMTIGLLQPGQPTPNVFNPFYRLQLRANSAGTATALRGGGVDTVAGNPPSTGVDELQVNGSDVLLQQGVTYDFFAVLDTTNDELDLYLQADADPLFSGAPVLVGSGGDFDNSLDFSGISQTDIGTLSAVAFNDDPTVNVLFDNLYVDTTGQNLISPVAATAVPEPGSALLGLAAIGGIAARRRRNRK